MYAQRTKCLDSLQGTRPRAEIISQALAQSSSLQPPPPNCSGSSGVVSSSVLVIKQRYLYCLCSAHAHMPVGRGVHLCVLVPQQLKVSDPWSWGYKRLWAAWRGCWNRTRVICRSKQMLLIAGLSLHSLFWSVYDELLGWFFTLQGSKRVRTGLTLSHRLTSN